MNTANLQIEGVLLALSAILAALRKTGALDAAAIEAALREAERAAAADPRRPAELSPAHLDAIRFPLRYLRQAMAGGETGALPPFGEVAAAVGRDKNADPAGEGAGRAGTGDGPAPAEDAAGVDQTLERP